MLKRVIGVRQSETSPETSERARPCESAVLHRADTSASLSVFIERNQQQIRLENTENNAEADALNSYSFFCKKKTKQPPPVATTIPTGSFCLFVLHLRLTYSLRNVFLLLTGAF